MLEGKRLLITGVLTRQSIAWAVAERAQALGAEVVLTGFGRTRKMTERAARALPSRPEVLELDVTSEEDLAALAAELGRHWDGLEGLLHGVAFAPPDAIGGNFLSASATSAATAFEVSAFSLKALAVALLPLLAEGNGRPGVVGLDFDASAAWPSYDWMGVAKAALESVNRYLARDLGERGVRVNLVASGPLRTVAAGGIRSFDDLARIWTLRAPLGWDLDDHQSVADPICFLFSDLARCISGEIVHVDGGFHAIGTAMGPGRID
jgi:meromycolic acid enoyl-[acyl-carrier-protein] reductase